MRRSVFVAVVFAGFCVPGRASKSRAAGHLRPLQQKPADIQSSRRILLQQAGRPAVQPHPARRSRSRRNHAGGLREATFSIPVRLALKDRRPMIRVLLTVYGMPLRIGEQVPSPAEKAQLDKLRPDVEAVSAEIQKLQPIGPHSSRPTCKRTRRRHWPRIWSNGRPCSRRPRPSGPPSKTGSGN